MIQEREQEWEREMILYGGMAQHGKLVTLTWLMVNKLLIHQIFVEMELMQ